MRDREDLLCCTKLSHEVADLLSDGTAYAGVHFVEHQCRHIAQAAGGDCHRERQSGQFTARGDFPDGAG